jgi:1-acyl-sn-glycerol-3-phosphate acyltransferase
MIARYIRSLWVWTVSGLLFLIWVPVMALVRLFDRGPLALRTGRSLRLLGRLLIRVHLQKLHIRGFENIGRSGPYIIVANHQSLIDIPLVSYIPLDTKCMARADLFRIPWVGWTLRMSREISIDRKDPRNAARAMRHCVKVLRAGCSVLIYAEGTRSPDGNLLPFSEGPFQLAIREKIPVLPVVIDGTGRNLGKNDLLFQRTHPMSLRILKPVPVEGWGVKQAGDLRDFVRDTMAAELLRSPERSG